MRKPENSRTIVEGLLVTASGGRPSPRLPVREALDGDGIPTEEEVIGQALKAIGEHLKKNFKIDLTPAELAKLRMPGAKLLVDSVEPAEPLGLAIDRFQYRLQRLDTQGDMTIVMRLVITFFDRGVPDATPRVGRFFLEAGKLTYIPEDGGAQFPIKLG